MDYLYVYIIGLFLIVGVIFMALRSGDSNDDNKDQ